MSIDPLHPSNRYQVIRLSTGSRGLDDLLSGGFVQGKTFLIAGEPGTGKTTLCLRYVLAGLERGENAIYVALDERPLHVIQDAAALGWDLAPYLEAEKLLFLDLSGSFTSLQASKMEEVPVESLLDGIAMHAQRVNATRIVIDPIAPLVFGQREDLVRTYIRKLLMNLDEKLGTTTLITSHIPPGSMGLSQFGVEEFLVSGVIKLALKSMRGSYTRTLLIRKMRETPVDLTEYAFDIVPLKGIVIRHAF